MMTAERTGFERAPVRVSRSLRYKSGAGKVKVKLEGHCRMCLRAAAELRDLPDHPNAIREMTRHHLVPQYVFRDSPTWKHLKGCDANVVPLCRACHDLVELPDYEGGEDGKVGLEYRRELRAVLTQAEISFVIQTMGAKWLEARYPLRYLVGKV